MGWLRRNSIWVASFIGGFVFNVALQKGFFNNFPDWLLGALVLVIAGLFLFGIWFHPDIQKKLRLLYNRRPKMLFPLLILIGACTGAVIGALAAWSIQQQAHVKETETKEEAATRADVDQLKQQLDRVLARLQTEPPIESRPGFSLHSIVNFRAQSEARRKYFMDIRTGATGRGRLSVYFDSSNTFTLALVDENGEPHLVQVPPRHGGVPLGEYIYLACEVGLGVNSTLMRVMVNGEEVGRLNLTFRVNLERLDLQGGKLGANFEGRENGAFEVSEVCIYGYTLTSTDLGKLLRYFRGKFFEPNHTPTEEEKLGCKLY